MSFSNEDQNQIKYLQEAFKSVRLEAFHMKRAIDAEDSHKALGHASEMLRELRTSLLTPKNYYSLSIQVLEDLRSLESFIEDVVWKKQGVAMEKFYERVQSCGNVLPRLYLLITASAVYMKSCADEEDKIEDILMDLLEMTKGVQTPLRGLFVRNYLSQVAKDHLAGVRAIPFLIQNLTEMNRLWIRLASNNRRIKGGNTRLKKLREIERQELRLLVGTSLVRLSDISGLCDEITYTRLILPPVFNVIISCHDPTAQEYLVDCFIQVFPDEFHLTNLVLILDNLVLLDSSVDMDSIITRFIERLPASSSDIEKKNSPCQETLEHFHVFIFNYIQRHVVQPSSGTTIRQVMGLFSTVLTWTSSSFAQENPAMRMSMIQKVLRDCLAFSQRPDILGPSHVEHEMGFIMDALEGMCERCFESNVEQVMTWPEIRKVLDMMVPRSRRVRLAIQLVKTLVSRRSLEFKLTSNSEVDRLMHLIEPLIKDDLSSVSSESESRVSSPTLRHKESFEEIQQLVAKLVFHLSNDSPDLLFQLFCKVRTYFGQGGVQRIQTTLLPLVFRALDLVQHLDLTTSELSQRQVLQFVHEIVTAMGTQHQVLAFRLFLQCALSADTLDQSTIAYEFLTQAQILYDDVLRNDHRLQVEAISNMIGTLVACRHLSSEHLDILRSMTCQNAASCLKLQDQCRVVTQCALLFLQTQQPRALECLQKALQIADEVVTISSPVESVELFVEILEMYMFCFENQVREITWAYLEGLVALIQEHLENTLDDRTPTASRQRIEQRYRDTCAYMHQHLMPQEEEQDNAAVRSS